MFKIKNLFKLSAGLWVYMQLSLIRVWENLFTLVRCTQLAHKSVSTNEKNYLLLNHWINCSSPMIAATRSIISILFWLRSEFENPATTIITTNSILGAAWPLDHHLEKCSSFRGTSMNYACQKVEILSLSLKYPTICENLFQLTFVTCSDLIQGSPMQPEDHEMTLIGYSSFYCATSSLIVKLKFSINLQMLKVMLHKICLCCRLTNIQVYEWAVIILDTLDYLGTCIRIKSL